MSGCIFSTLALTLILTVKSICSFEFGSRVLLTPSVGTWREPGWYLCRADPSRSWKSRCRLGAASLTCGLQVMVRIRGRKSREEDFMNQAFDEYAKRLRPVLTLDTHWHKTDEDLEAAVRKDSGAVVCLDERGRQMDSMTFSSLLFSKLEEGGSRLTFVVGGAEGLPQGLKDNPPRGGKQELTDP